METMKPETIQNYGSMGFVGNDVSLAVSLFEYGLIWNPVPDSMNQIEFVYGVETNKSGNYNRFNYSYIDSDCNILDEYDCADFDGIINYTGSSCAKWHKQELVHKIWDLLSYHGYENIFGTCESAFKIKNN